ncbi:hypothetical protein [Salinigranum marinum]|uniref:hypothetical protein n=1 Tax=Salinigranum marinum TaxID=1515595 RepID=UPI00298A0196|nr:hypothetical protein [Salinigranum marinum]
MNRGALVLVALALVGATSITGVGSVSSVSADRGVSVAVAPDGEAYLGIEFGPPDNGTRDLVVSNHVSTDDVTVTVDGDGFESTADAGPGDPAEFAVSCGSTVELVGVGSGVRIEATRDVEECTPSGPGGDDADENGEAEDGEDGDSGDGDDTDENDEGEDGEDGDSSDGDDTDDGDDDDDEDE